MKCQAQIDLHRLYGRSLNTLAWKMVEDELNSMQNFYVFKYKELKNQWYYLKKQWQVWRGLINWTGYGYDPVSGTFEWSEEVWENIIVVNSEARKYKTVPLQHRDLLEKLFEGLSATRDLVWSLGMESVPSSTQQSEYVPLPNDMNVDDTQVLLAGVNYPWDGEAIPSYYAPISPVREPTPGSTSRSCTPTPQLSQSIPAGSVVEVTCLFLGDLEKVSNDSTLINMWKLSDVDIWDVHFNVTPVSVPSPIDIVVLPNTQALQDVITIDDGPEIPVSQDVEALTQSEPIRIPKLRPKVVIPKKTYNKS
ncbi:hypothetical protein GIB67_018491, partial [Kingdonia uniflora]